MRLVPKIPTWGTMEVLEREPDCNSQRGDWTVRGEEASKLFALSNGDVDILPLLPTSVSRTGRNYVSTISSKHGALETE